MYMFNTFFPQPPTELLSNHKKLTHYNCYQVQQLKGEISSNEPASTRTGLYLRVILLISPTKLYRLLFHALHKCNPALSKSSTNLT